MAAGSGCGPGLAPALSAMHRPAEATYAVKIRVNVCLIFIASCFQVFDFDLIIYVHFFPIAKQVIDDVTNQVAYRIFNTN